MGATSENSLLFADLNSRLCDGHSETSNTFSMRVMISGSWSCRRLCMPFIRSIVSRGSPVKESS